VTASGKYLHGATSRKIENRSVSCAVTAELEYCGVVLCIVNCHIIIIVVIIIIITVIHYSDQVLYM
jgi:hypothetical protein